MNDTGKYDFNSCFYECRVIHKRLVPRHHKFSYGLFMMYIDLDELINLDTKSRLFSVDSANIFSFYQGDHLKDESDPSSNLLERLKYYAAQNGISAPIAKVHLLTLPRIFGYVFNPVSFYFLFDDNGSACGCIAEVGNTFNEMKTYVLNKTVKSNGSVCFRLTAPKHFYVSPYGKLDDSFDFILPVPGDKINLCIDTVSSTVSDSGIRQKVLISSLSGSARPFDEKRLCSYLWRYPLLTVKVIAMIHWQAFLLLCKKVPFFAKEENPHLQSDVRNPHRRSVENERQISHR